MKDLSKGKHNPQSKQAHKKVNAQIMQQRVYNLINGKRSTIEIMRILKVDALHKISGRFTELKKLNRIECIGVKKGFSVYKTIENEC